MTMYWEREAHLFEGLSPAEIADIEQHYSETMVRIQFSMNPSFQQPDNPLSNVNFRKEIETICEERFGLTFHGGISEHGQQPLRTPIQRTALAWAAPRRGYLFLGDIFVVMLYQYAGVLSNGLSYHQLEYRNRSKLAPADILCALRALGDTDAIVQNYSRMSGAHGPRDHWAAIGCVNWPTEGNYRFRLVILSQIMAETVYANYRLHAAGTNRLDHVPPSMKLHPLRDLSWDNPSSTFFHPLAVSATKLVATKVRIGPLPTITTPEDILAALHGSQLLSPDVDIIDNYATLTFDSPSPAAFLWYASGPHGTTRLYVRNIAIQLHVLMGRSRTTAVAKQCPDCGRLDHQGKPCDRFTYLDPRDRARSKSRHKPTTRGAMSPGARSRSKSVHTRAGRSVSQHSTTVSHTPQSWQYPPQQLPLYAPAPTADLVPHLRRELSTYVDHRIVQATAPLQQEVDTLRVDKEALTALVSATSAAFTSLDARLLEVCEAAEHQQSEDQRTLTEAQNRLETTITQQGTHQAAMAERLPIIESSLRTLMQAMQSVSTQLTGLAALGTPVAQLPAAYPTQPTLKLSAPTPDGSVPPNQPAGSDDSMGTDPNDTMGSN
ncbi:hypothetical protein H257_18368 [Aphanomyces astaci]|uniref:Uncharacterized protein n=2 Tax=Aphanomyces astaci TaxID=112090 RepID=W4FBD5_APHAT|nr:hypothetical protein H257_18368 [Aphanomyces astaci]ETV64792.1 hypothetical protein H257_18368 [Aphanomyces astaci]|eukprot:XP_009845711.1 hypothetical protein H257_18368 [Aphanomyces astaci]